MLTSEQAIEKAFGFLKGLKPEYLGATPESIRLETLQRFGKDWVVVLSYYIRVKPAASEADASLTNKLLEALSSRRFIKEIEIDAESGELLAMRNPEAPATTGEPIEA